MAHGLPGFKDLLIMVADDVFQYSLLHVSGDPIEMVEALIHFCILGLFCLREHGLEFQTDEDGVFHLALGAAWVDVLAVNGDAHGSCVEGLVFHLAEGSAVHCISHIGAPAGYVEEIHAVSHFFVGSKGDLDGPVGDLRMCHEIFSHSHDLGNTGLIVSAQKAGAVGGDQVLAHIVL